MQMSKAWLEAYKKAEIRRSAEFEGVCWNWLSWIEERLSWIRA